jgi:U3 small nucleolar RNA-associated protein 11
LANLIAPQDDDLVGDGDDALDDSDLETLREAGVIPPETKRRSLARHIMFAENEAEGEFILQRYLVHDMTMNVS